MRNNLVLIFIYVNLIFVYVRAPVWEGVLPGGGGVPRWATGAGADSESSSQQTGANGEESPTPDPNLGPRQQN